MTNRAEKGSHPPPQPCCYLLASLGPLPILSEMMTQAFRVCLTPPAELLFFGGKIPCTSRSQALMSPHPGSLLRMKSSLLGWGTLSTSFALQGIPGSCRFKGSSSGARPALFSLSTSAPDWAMQAFHLVLSRLSSLPLHPPSLSFRTQAHGGGGVPSRLMKGISGA